MKYDSLSHSAISRNVSITIRANWADEVCHLEISKSSASKGFFHEPQIKSSLETWIFLKVTFVSVHSVEPWTLSDAQNQNRNPVSICETHNSTPDLKRSLGPNNMYGLLKLAGLTLGTLTTWTSESSAQLPLIYVLQISCLHILIIDYFNYILKKNLSPTKKMSTRYSQVISPVQSPLSR